MRAFGEVTNYTDAAAFHHEPAFFFVERDLDIFHFAVGQIGFGATQLDQAFVPVQNLGVGRL